MFVESALSFFNTFDFLKKFHLCYDLTFFLFLANSFKCGVFFIFYFFSSEAVLGQKVLVLEMSQKKTRLAVNFMARIDFLALKGKKSSNRSSRKPQQMIF